MILFFSTHSLWGKTHERVPILPSTTRKGTTLNISDALDSPSVLSKLLTPPHPHVTHTATSAECENTFENLDDASAVLDKSGSLGPFLETKIARAKQIERTAIPFSSPEPRENPNDDGEEAYIDLDQLDDDFIDECHATNDASAVRNLLANRAVRYKSSPDANFATSLINIKDKDYDFSLDLSYISIVEKEPFCGTENESAMKHMNELSYLSNLFSDDNKIRTYFVTKIFPFSLKGAAKIWYDNVSWIY